MTPPPARTTPPPSVVVHQAGIVSSIASATSATLNTLPGQFLALVLINMLFIGGLLWFLDREEAGRRVFEARSLDARERLLAPLLKACVDDTLKGDQ